MTRNDQVRIGKWLRARGEMLRWEVDDMIAKTSAETVTMEQLAEECKLHGRALATLELARDVLNPDWLSEVMAETGVDS